MLVVWNLLVESWTQLRALHSGLMKRRKENWRLSSTIYHEFFSLEELTVRNQSYCTVLVIYSLYTDWVVQLGPPSFDSDLYQYAVVSNRWKSNLFVLARNVTEFKLQYDDEVTAKLKEQGFTKFYNRPTETYQGSDCMYIEELTDD